MAQTLSKKICSALTSLCFDHKWLNDYQEPFSQLISSCSSEEEVSLLCDLLNRLTFLTSSDRSPLWEGMATQIVDTWGLPENRTQIVATTHQADEADSAQSVLQALKVRLRSRGWPRPKLVNRIGGSVSRIAKYPVVVLVDEFMGTGTTMQKRILDHKREYLKHVNDVDIRVCVLASMQHALDVLTKEGIQAHVELVLRKGISDHYTGSALVSACYSMLRLESKLDPGAGMEKFHSFGYGQAESLYATDEGNATNCMFPIFWWEHLRNRKTRRPMFCRAENAW